MVVEMCSLPKFVGFFYNDISRKLALLLFAHNYSIPVKERKNKTQLSSLDVAHLLRFRDPFIFGR